ncbi:MAG TPA: GNAT family N-acetyltransferase [Rubricoccaceae bacterium]|jgi:ribosomal protein S18 acetylase RimI-like enzyme
MATPAPAATQANTGRPPAPDPAYRPVVFRAGVEHLDGLAVLFDAYRTFYRRTSDLGGARHFLRNRLTGGESIVFAARLPECDGLAGFTQLYPTFSSVRMRRVWTLNDLFVTEGARGHGVARELMEAARTFAVETGAASIQLETERTNVTAQALYDGLGYGRGSGSVHYELTLEGT